MIVTRTGKACLGKPIRDENRIRLMVSLQILAEFGGPIRKRLAVRGLLVLSSET